MNALAAELEQTSQKQGQVMRVKKKKEFSNGIVYLLETEDGYPVETTDTFLPFYTKDAVGRKQNSLASSELGSRAERWMIGVSTMSGCPVRCKFCATGKLKKWRSLTTQEIVDQVLFVLKPHASNVYFHPPREFKINYTRMGEPFLNITAVREAIERIDRLVPWPVHHYVSTIGVEGSDFSWVKDNVTLQVSLHSLDVAKRNWLIPYNKKLGIDELGKIRTASDLKTTVNLTLPSAEDFDILELRKHFDPEHFFIKLSPINENEISDKNALGSGIVTGKNLA